MHPPPEPSRLALPAIISAGAVLLVGGVTVWLVELGPLSALMVQHLLVMNVIAPLAAATLAGGLTSKADRTSVLWGIGLAQILLLWGWHAPVLQRAAGASAVLHLALLGLLTGTAILFWAVLLRAGAQSRWGGIAALLVTGKLACLLGGLLIFAPRELYGLASLAFTICRTGPSTLADQQLAGLMMIAACPLSYVVAGVVMATQILLDLERRSAARGALPEHFPAKRMPVCARKMRPDKGLEPRSGSIGAEEALEGSAP
jgi:putative membrane protein